VGDVVRTVTNVSILGPQVVLLTMAAAGDPGPDVVSYSPPPFDIISDTAKPTAAPAFADFPVT
jgi:hypothetical protein